MILAFSQTYSTLCMLRVLVSSYLTTYLLPIFVCGFSILISGAPKAQDFVSVVGVHVSSLIAIFSLPCWCLLRIRNFLILMWCNLSVFSSYWYFGFYFSNHCQFCITVYYSLFISFPYKPGEQGCAILQNLSLDSQ